MKIAILSDLHITHDGHPIWGVDTRLNLFKAVEHLRSIDNLSAIFCASSFSCDFLNAFESCFAFNLLMFSAFASTAKLFGNKKFLPYICITKRDKIIHNIY